MRNHNELRARTVRPVLPQHLPAVTSDLGPAALSALKWKEKLQRAAHENDPQHGSLVFFVLHSHLCISHCYPQDGAHRPEVRPWSSISLPSTCTTGKWKLFLAGLDINAPFMTECDSRYSPLETISHNNTVISLCRLTAGK